MMSEKHDSIETELKFLPPGQSDADTLSIIQEALPPDYCFNLLEPVGLEDLYLDTPDLLLYKRGATLRFRTFVDRKKMVANFKPPRNVMGNYMVRNEIRTAYSAEEALDMINHKHRFGKAFKHFQELYSQVTGDTNDSELIPTVWIHSFRRTFAVCSRDYILGNRPPMYIGISFENVHAYEITDDVDVTSLVLSRFLSAPVKEAVFKQAEIESWGELEGVESEMLEIMNVMERLLIPHLQTGFLVEPKYARAMNLLHIND